MSDALLLFPERRPFEKMAAAFGDAMRQAKSVMLEMIEPHLARFPQISVGLIREHCTEFRNVDALLVHDEGMHGCVLLAITGELYRCPMVRVGDGYDAEMRPNWSAKEETPAVWAEYGLLALEKLTAIFPD